MIVRGKGNLRSNSLAPFLIINPLWGWQIKKISKRAKRHLGLVSAPKRGRHSPIPVSPPSQDSQISSEVGIAVEHAEVQHLPPFTPMDGSSFAPAIANTIPIMNHSFLILSSSLMFVRAGGFCLFVWLFFFLSCYCLISGASPHFPRSHLTCSRASQIATRKLKTGVLLRQL